MAKNISGGFFPFGAVYTSKKVADYFNENVLSCGLTNYAHPVGLRVCLEVLDLIEDEKFLETNEQLSQTLEAYKQKFQSLSIVSEVRNIGCLMAIEVNKKFQWSDFIKENLYLNIAGNNLIVTPIMTTSKNRLETALDKLLETLKKDNS